MASPTKSRGGEENLKIDADLLEANEAAMTTGSITPLLKKELWLKIQCRRLSEGKEELVIPPTPSRDYQISQAERAKKMRRQEQNRRAAKKFRSKEKGRRGELLEKIDVLEESNKELEEERMSMIRQKNEILLQLCQHLQQCRTCPAPSLDQILSPPAVPASVTTSSALSPSAAGTSAPAATAATSSSRAAVSASLTTSAVAVSLSPSSAAKLSSAAGSSSNGAERTADYADRTQKTKKQKQTRNSSSSKSKKTTPKTKKMTKEKKRRNKTQDCSYASSTEQKDSEAKPKSAEKEGQATTPGFSQGLAFFQIVDGKLCLGPAEPFTAETTENQQLFGFKPVFIDSSHSTLSTVSSDIVNTVMPTSLPTSSDHEATTTSQSGQAVTNQRIYRLDNVRGLPFFVIGKAGSTFDNCGQRSDLTSTNEAETDKFLQKSQKASSNLKKSNKRAAAETVTSETVSFSIGGVQELFTASPTANKRVATAITTETASSSKGETQELSTSSLVKQKRKLADDDDGDDDDDVDDKNEPKKKKKKKREKKSEKHGHHQHLKSSSSQSSDLPGSGLQSSGFEIYIDDDSGDTHPASTSTGSNTVPIGKDARPQNTLSLKDNTNIRKGQQDLHSGVVGLNAVLDSGFVQQLLGLKKQEQLPSVGLSNQTVHGCKDITSASSETPSTSKSQEKPACSATPEMPSPSMQQEPPSSEKYDSDFQHFLSTCFQSLDGGRKEERRKDEDRRRHIMPVGQEGETGGQDRELTKVNQASAFNRHTVPLSSTSSSSTNDGSERPDVSRTSSPPSQRQSFVVLTSLELRFLMSGDKVTSPCNDVNTNAVLGKEDHDLIAAAPDFLLSASSKLDNDQAHEHRKFLTVLGSFGKSPARVSAGDKTLTSTVSSVALSKSLELDTGLGPATGMHVLDTLSLLALIGGTKDQSDVQMFLAAAATTTAAPASTYDTHGQTTAVAADFDHCPDHTGKQRDHDKSEATHVYGLSETTHALSVGEKGSVSESSSSLLSSSQPFCLFSGLKSLLLLDSETLQLKSVGLMSPSLSSSLSADAILGSAAKTSESANVISAKADVISENAAKASENAHVISTTVDVVSAKTDALSQNTDPVSAKISIKTDEISTQVLNDTDDDHNAQPLAATAAGLERLDCVPDAQTSGASVARMGGSPGDADRHTPAASASAGVVGPAGMVGPAGVVGPASSPGDSELISWNEYSRLVECLLQRLALPGFEPKQS